MSYYPIGHRASGDDDDDFKELDPDIYGGGYDISLTYGRGLPPSLDTCYRNSLSASNYFDYGHPQYTSHAKPSAYAGEALANEYRSYARPMPRERPLASADWYGRSGPRPDFGFQSGGGGSEGFRRSENEHGKLELGHGPAHGGISSVSGFGPPHGRIQEFGNPGLRPGHERRSENESFSEKSIYPMPSYPPPPFHPVPNYPQPPIHSVPNYPQPPIHPVPSYPQPPHFPTPNYQEPGYQENHWNSGYGDAYSTDEEKRLHHHRHY